MAGMTLHQPSDNNPKSSKTVSTGRSPSYPVFDLETAVTKLRLFYNVQRSNSVSIEAAVESMGYTTKSGTALRAIAALIGYDLLQEEGKGDARKVRITTTGRHIILLDDNDSDKLIALRQAALKPKIFNEMASRWPDTLPSDRELVKFLTFDKGYNEDSVRNLIRDFKATYEFAKLNEKQETSNSTLDVPSQIDKNNGNNFSGNDTDEFGSRNAKNKKENEEPAGLSEKNETRSWTIPLSGGRAGLLQLPEPVSERDFTFITKFCNLLAETLDFNTKTPQASVISDESYVDSEIRTGKALWHAKDADQLVVVIGFAGIYDGRKYVSIEGSTTAIPVDEIDFQTS